MLPKTLRHRFVIGYIQKWDLHRLWYGGIADLKRRRNGLEYRQEKGVNVKNKKFLR